MIPSKAKQYRVSLEKVEMRMKKNLDRMEHRLGNLNGKQYSYYQRAKEAYKLLNAAISKLRSISPRKEG